MRRTASRSGSPRHAPSTSWPQALLGASILACAAAAPAVAADYARELVVPGSNFHGVHGITAGPDGKLYAGSVVGGSVYKVDPATGDTTTLIGSPEGMADDLEFGPDGTLVYTSFLSGIVHARAPDGTIRELATGLPGINSIAWAPDGRLYATQVFLGDALYEIDPKGEKPPRKILEGMGGLNGFDFGPDGKLYGPLWFKGQVAQVDVDSGTLKVVADGFKTPAAANFDSKGNLYVVDTAAGEVVRVDPASGGKKVVAQVQPSIDNLAFDEADRLYITNMANAAVYEIDPSTGESRTVTEGRLSVPSGIAVWSEDGKDTIYIADLFAYRTVDAGSGAVDDRMRMHADGIHLEYPMSARANADHVILSSWFTGTVQTLDRRTGESLALWHDFAAPYDAVELPDGSLLVAEVAKGALTIAPAEKAEDRRTLVDGLQGPQGLALDGKGGVFVTEAAGIVSRVDLKSGGKSVIAEGLVLPEGIDVLADGRLAVAEVGKKRLILIDPQSGAIEVAAEDLPIGLPGLPTLPPAFVPTGVAAGSDGSIYLSSDLENAVYRLSPR